ncbi:MAG: HAMP domain-containing protein [Candidatus Saganbacteria bacterium]|nr:HAMP domain-containing protein [Candidatus Saganbacteria bacterium]
MAESPGFGFIPSPVIGLQAGHLYNVVISLIVVLGCGFAAWMIYAHGRKSGARDSFALFLALIALYWLGFVVVNAAAWAGWLQQIKPYAYVAKFKMILPALALAYFFAVTQLQGRIWERLVLYYFIFAGILFVLTSYHLDLTFHSLSYWGVKWQVTAIPQVIYLVGMLLPLAALALLAMLRRDLAGSSESRAADNTLYLGVVVFALLEYLQIVFEQVSWQALLARLLYVLIAFGAYLVFVERKLDRTFVPRQQNIGASKCLRVSFFLKLLLIFIGLAVVPITVACLLMFISFKEIIDIYIYKPLLWNLKTSREAFILALDHVQVQALFLTLLTGLLVFIAAVLVSRSIAASLKALAQGMSRVSRGDFSFKLQPQSNDELGDVTGYFNDMSVEIERSREIMERWNHELEIKVAERTEDLRILYNISKAIGSSLDFDLLMSRAVNNLLPAVKASAFCVLLPKGQGRFISRLSQGMSLPLIDLNKEQGLLAEAMANKTIVSSSDINKDMRCTDRLYRELELTALIVAPLRAKGRTLGLLLLGSGEAHEYSVEHELSLVATVADQLAVAVENINIYEKEKEAVARLTELDRLKNEFISMVSHELRTPVTSVDGYVSLFLAGAAGPLTEEQKNYLSIVQNNDQRLLTLIDRLLDFSRIESGRFTINKELVSLNEIIDEALKMLKPQLEKKKAGIKLALSARNNNFMGDRSKMKQVITNLVENALKFSAEGRPLLLTIATADAGDFIRVEIADNGIGIEGSDLQRIFNKFFQVEDTLTRKVGGIGLGLAIAKEIIGNHNGRIWAESKGKDRGASFIFMLPVAEKI